MRLSACDENNYPPKTVDGDCPVCSKPLGLGGIDCAPTAKKIWYHHNCQMEMIMQSSTSERAPTTTNMEMTSIKRASIAAGEFLDKSGTTDMALMSYEDWCEFIATICHAYTHLEDDEIPF